MDLGFWSQPLKTLCSNRAALEAEFGPVVAAALAQRLYEIWAAPTLADLAMLPTARVSSIDTTESRVAVRIVDGAQLILEPLGGPPPPPPTQIVAVTVVDIKHAKGGRSS